VSRLPGPKKKGSVSLEETLQERRSKRSFISRSLSQEQISQLLWAAQGATHRNLRTAPSAGALYPLEIHLVSREGVHHYKPQLHELERTVEGDVMVRLAGVALGQEYVREAPINIVIAAVCRRAETRYGERAFRYICIEVGHVAQNVHLQATAMGLGSVPVGAFNDDQLRSILALPPDQIPLYIIPVGYAAE